MQTRTYATLDQDWPFTFPTSARIALFLVLTMFVALGVYAGWQGARITSLAREATETPAGEVTGAFQNAVGQTYRTDHSLLGSITWVIGMTDAFAFALGLYVLSSVSLIGAVPTGWSRAAVLTAWLLVGVGWQYVDLLKQLSILLD